LSHAGVERLAAQIEGLRRLGERSYDSEEALFAAFLDAGKQAFNMPCGAVLDEQGALLAGDSRFQPSLQAELSANGRRLGRILFGGSPVCGVDSKVAEVMAQTLAREILDLRAAREQQRLSQELEWQAWHDPLTKLPNRGRLAEWVRAAMTRADQSRGRVALLFIDLDRIKPVNDALGHGVGDDVLISAAARIQASMQGSERALRLGADEFVVIAPEISTSDDAALVARRLLDALRKPHLLSGYELFITASIGISLYPDHGRTEKALLQTADAAMYRAKKQGRNGFRVFSSELIAHSLDRFELENQLGHALKNEELELLYQPIFRLDGALDSLEVLLAWNSPVLGRLAAAQFINIAEETGIIVTLGPWVLRRACEQCERWASAGHPINIAVNVSALEFARSDFVEGVTAILRETGLPGSRLELEVTESTLLLDLGDTAKTFTGLRDLGVSLAIDDFGTGYSSLNYLRRLPAHALKIDQSFLSDLDSATVSVPLLRAIVAMAHTIGMVVTAEGVERKDQLGVLRMIGCDKAQGHLFGGALPAAEIEPLLERGPQ
jgi:diguanylate cyclase (GGDEF)-like protein